MMMPIIIPPSGGGAPISFKEFLIVLAAIIAFFWIGFTLLTWMFPSFGHPTLVEVLKAQFEWFKALKVW